MTQKGEHTWDIVIDYHQCPSCGFINEDRKEYQENKGTLTKEIACCRCGKPFTIQKKLVKHFGPLFGQATPPDYTWD